MFENDLAKIAGAKFQRTFVGCIYDGDNLSEACAKLKINPAALGIFISENETFDGEIRKAMAFRMDLLVDRLPNIDDDIEDALMARVVSQNIQWLAAKRGRKNYGEKLDINHNVKVDIRAAILDARNRSLGDIEHKPLIELNSVTDNTTVAQLQYVDDDDDIDPLS